MAQYNKKIDRQKILYGIAAVLVFGLLLGVTCFGRMEHREPSAMRIVMLGDSIIGEYRGDTSVPINLTDLLGKDVINCALGGTSMGRLDRDMRLAYTKDFLSMHALAQAIATSDFGAQQTVRSRENATEHFEATINTLEQIDFESMDILFIGHGMNDYQAGVQISNAADAYDSYTYTGAIRSAVEMLQEAYPELRIILLTPTYSWYIFHEKAEQDCENCDFGGGVLEDYVNAEIELAESMGVEVIDLYHDFYPHEQWSDWSIYTHDGVHPNEAGRQLIAEEIYNYLLMN